ncbi:hypothetical protein FHG87_019057 [Trinorchestia longiramus]|nr:hypothetical protein FHG87_019057 [Trinorchestia longiramus]
MIVNEPLLEKSNFQKKETFECELPWWDGGNEDCKKVTRQFMIQENKTRSYCGKRADVLGKGQKVVTYCFFGDFQSYALGLPEILQKIKIYYPGWVVRLYTEPQNYSQELQPLLLQHSNFYICDVTNLPGSIHDLRGVDARLWRVAVLGDELVDVFLSRDLDAEIIEREVAATEEFLRSGKALHIMRDHPYHYVPILAGMFGVNQTASNFSLLNSIREQLFMKRKRKIQDQVLLNNHLVSKLKSSMISHDSYRCKKFPNSTAFPTRRDKQGLFVGNRRYRKNLGNETIKKECPIECRPAAHKDWTHC